MSGSAMPTPTFLVLERATSPGAGDRERHPRCLDVHEQPFAVRAVVGPRPFVLAVVAGWNRRVERRCQDDIVLGEGERAAVERQPNETFGIVGRAAGVVFAHQQSAPRSDGEIVGVLTLSRRWRVVDQFQRLGKRVVLEYLPLA